MGIVFGCTVYESIEGGLLMVQVHCGTRMVDAAQLGMSESMIPAFVLGCSDVKPHDLNQ